MTVLQLHILSKVLFQAGAWASLSPKALRRVHVAVMFAYRIVADAAYSGTAPTLTDQEVLRLTKAVAPINLLRLARILLLIRVCAKAPAYNIATIMIAAQAKTSWLFSASMDIGLVFITSRLHPMQHGPSRCGWMLSAASRKNTNDSSRTHAGARRLM